MSLLTDSLHANVAHNRQSVFPVPVGLSSRAFLLFCKASMTLDI
jgi:hypothetical protein